MRKRDGSPELYAVIGGQPAQELEGREQLVRAYVARDGGRAAAWWVRRHRRKFHTKGAVDFFLPEGAEMPRWARWAFAALKLKPAKWAVIEIGVTGGTKHRVVWKGWLTNGPKHREERERRARNQRKRLRALRS